MIIQLCGLSGAGKTTLARRVKKALELSGASVAILDGDNYRNTLCRDLTFSRKDREENIRRMAFVAHELSSHGVIAILSAINPYRAIRDEVCRRYPQVLTVHVYCPLEVLVKHDTKGLYQRSLLPNGHPGKLSNLSGVGDPFEAPLQPDLLINTAAETPTESTSRLVSFIQSKWNQLQEEVVAPMNKLQTIQTIAV